MNNSLVSMTLSVRALRLRLLRLQLLLLRLQLLQRGQVARMDQCPWQQFQQLQHEQQAPL
jgi:hypothetical protein